MRGRGEIKKEEKGVRIEGCDVQGRGGGGGGGGGGDKTDKQRC